MEHQVVESSGTVVPPLEEEEEGGQHVEVLGDVRGGGGAGARHQRVDDVPDVPDVSAGQDHPGDHRHVAPGHLGQGQVGRALAISTMAGDAAK